MGLFKKGLTFVGDTITGGGFQAKKQYDQGQAALNKAREESKARQMGHVDAFGRPTMSPQMQARLKALELESQAGPLSQDKYFQGDRANLVRNARQEVAGIENQNRAYGLQGGFANTGSVQDSYDRLSGQLAQLGQQSAQRKDQAAQQAAEGYQDQLDREMDFQTMQAKARLAVEQGDLDLAAQIIENHMNNRADSSRASYKNANDFAGRLVGSIMGTGGGFGGAK